jgi:hypothetical protein
MSQPTRDDGWRQNTEAHRLGTDASDFLTDEEIRHYNHFLGTGGQILVHRERQSAGWQWTATVLSPEMSPEQARRIREELAGYPPAIGSGYFTREGRGPDMCSSSRAVALLPEICWDVCGYYRRLGAHWRSTRKQLREAYMASGAAAGSGRAPLAYALAQLLNRAVRREYDLMPLGALFLRDAYTQELLKREAIRVAAGMYAQDGTEVSAEDILEEMGYSASDQQAPAAGEQPEAPRPLPRPGRPWDARWSWYRLSAYDNVSWRVPDLERWQLLLIRAFAEEELTVSFAVGLHTGDGIDVRAAASPGSLIIFLGRGEPTQQLARDAVDRARLALQL